MTQDEIIEMARQAGFVEYELDDGTTNAFDKRYEAFAKLVATKEREACANICETLELPEWPDKVRQPLAQAIRARGEQQSCDKP
jgi:hypothetical protein